MFLANSIAHSSNPKQTTQIVKINGRSPMETTPKITAQKAFLSHARCESVQMHLQVLHDENYTSLISSALRTTKHKCSVIWRSEDFQNVFWQSYVRSVYLLCPGDSALLILTNLHSSHYFHTCSQHYRRISNPSKWKSSMMFDRHLNTQQTFSCSKSTKKTRVKYSKRCE